MRRQKGFTLIELITVMSIIGILLTLGLSTYANHLKRSRDAKRKADLEQIRTALEMYRSDLTASQGRYPNYGWLKITGNDSLSNALITAGYISSIPTDPRNTGTNAGPCGNPELYRYNYRQIDNGAGYVLTAIMENTASNDSSSCHSLRNWSKTGWCSATGEPWGNYATYDYCYGVENP